MRETTNGLRESIEVDLQKLLLSYLSKWWLILLCAALAAGTAFLYTKYYVTPMYRASVTIYVNNSRSSETVDYISGSNLSTSKQLVNTYVNIIQSDTVLEEVVFSSGLPMTPAQVRSVMSASQVDETELFKVHISHYDPEMAARIANAVADVAPAKIGEIVEGSSTKIIDYAKVPKSYYTPSYSRNMFVGAMIGTLLALAYTTVMYLLDVRIKDEEDLSQLFDYPVLGQIPVFNQTAKRSDYETSQPAGAQKGKGG